MKGVNIMLDRETVDSLARGLVEIIDEINAFYTKPETEAAYPCYSLREIRRFIKPSGFITVCVLPFIKSFRCDVWSIDEVGNG